MCKLSTILFILLFSFDLSSQTITVLQRERETKLREFEQEFLIDIIELYNFKYDSTLKLNFQLVPNYKSIFDTLKTSSNTTLSINAITWTKEREKHYDFSVPYMPITSIIMGKSGVSYDLENKPYIVNYKRNTVHKETATQYANDKKFKLDEYQEHIDVFSVLDSENISIGDYTDIWYTDEFQLLKTLDKFKNSNYCIMYPQNSTLRKKLDSIILYYTKSSKFYLLLKRILGNDISTYFRDLKFHKNKH